MRRPIHTFLIVICPVLVGAELDDAAILSELPFGELLARKKVLEGGDVTMTDEGPMALPLVDESPDAEMRVKGFHRRQPTRKTFHDYDDEDEKGQKKKKMKKKTDKGHDLLNTSITALSYLAFGGYLLCMIASALREKRRRIMMTYPTAGPTMSNHFSSVLQNLGHRPHRPFHRFPAVTVHQGKKRRRSAPPFDGGRN